MQESKKIRCLVIDDELPAREILKQHIAGIEVLELSGICSNALDAISFLKDHTVDLLFLDIQMPQLLGTSFLRTLNNPPKVIFTTAFRKYAVEGFELNAVDYLLKPISFERFLKSVNKVLQMSLLANDSTSVSHSETSPPFLYFRCNRKMVKVLLDDILYIEGLNDYIRIAMTNKMIVSKHVLSSLEEMLPAHEFIRIHRSFIISIKKIDSYNADSVEIKGKEIPIGRMFKQNLNKVLDSAVIRQNPVNNFLYPINRNGDSPHSQRKI